jgi:small subunit ribosomal protein S18
MQRRGTGPQRSRTCELCRYEVKSLDYKDVDRLEQFVDEGSRIRSRRRTRTCARHQRMVTNAVKRARHVALLSFTATQHRALH